MALADPGISAAHLRAVCQDVLDLGAAQERLAGALLTLATGEQGVEHREPFDLARVAGAVVAGRAEEALRRAVDVRVDLGAAPATVDGRAVLTVRNTGAVVPPAELDRLFQPFQRLGAQRLGHTGGHGLGLAIVRAIAAAHGATLTPGGAARGAAWTSRCASADPL